MALKLQDGSSWNASAFKQWNGSAWVLRGGGHWNGTYLYPSLYPPQSVQGRIRDILDSMHIRAYNPTAPPQLLNAGAPPGAPAGGYLGGTWINWYGNWNGTDPNSTNINTNGQADSDRSPQDVTATSGGGIGHTYQYFVSAIYTTTESIDSSYSNVVTASSPNATITWNAGVGTATAYKVHRITDGGAAQTLAAATGAATAFTATTMTDSTANWTVNQWAGYVLSVLNNTTFAGKAAVVASNTATTLTFTGNGFGTSVPHQTDPYAISPPVTSPLVDNGSYMLANNDFSTAVRHDPTTDITYYRNLLDYKNLTGDSTYDGDAANMANPAYQEWYASTYYRGWPYFEMIKLMRLAPTQGWDTAAKVHAQNIFNSYYQAASGAIVDTSKTIQQYRVDYAWQCAAILLDAGQRFYQAPPAWSASVTYNAPAAAPVDVVTYNGNTYACKKNGVLNVPPDSDIGKWKQISNDTYSQAGAKVATYLLAQATSSLTGLPYATMRYNYPSPDTVMSPQCKSGETGQTIEFMLRVYQVGGDASVLTAAKKAFNVAVGAQSFNPGSGNVTFNWYDTVYGGFYFYVNADYSDTGQPAGTKVSNSYKEAGRQASWLRAANRMLIIEPSGTDAAGRSWTSWRDEFLYVYTVRMWKTGTALGYEYRLAPNFGIYNNETWATSEAMGVMSGTLLDHLQNANGGQA